MFSERGWEHRWQNVHVLTHNKNTDFTALVFSAPAGGGYLHLCHDIS